MIGYLELITNVFQIFFEGHLWVSRNIDFQFLDLIMIYCR